MRKRTQTSSPIKILLTDVSIDLMKCSVLPRHVGLLKLMTIFFSAQLMFKGEKAAQAIF